VALEIGYVPAAGERDPARLADAIRQIYQSAAGQSQVDSVTAVQLIVAAATSALSAERVLTDTASVTWDFSTPGQAKATAVGSGVSLKVGSFTRDLSTATGTAAVTGVGFQPVALILGAGIQGSGAAFWSVGFSDASSNTSISVLSGSGFSQNAFCIAVGTSGAAFQTATVDSMDSDGMTLGWTKTGSPTGTATIAYIAIG
jgi:hypothetical protein